MVAPHRAKPFALLLLLCILPVANAGADDVMVNLLWAEDRGCTPDDYSAADMRVTVKLDGKVILEAYAPQQNHPDFAAWVEMPRPAQTQRLTVRVEEGEPSGFLGLGTDFVNCDAAPSEEADVYGMDWDGSSQSIDVRGDTENSARIRIQLGDDAPAVPVATISDVTAKGATIHWDADPTGRATSHRVAAGQYGLQLRTEGPEAGSATFDDLCDGMPYGLRVIRDSNDWSISSKDVTFDTLNLPPDPPRILSAKLSNEVLSLEWEEPTPHDIDHYDIHTGVGDFAPKDETKSGTATSINVHDARGTARPKEGATHVKVVAIDEGGLTATSPAFRIGDDDQERNLRGRKDCGTLRDADNASQAKGGQNVQGSPAPSLVQALLLVGLATFARRFTRA